MSKPTVLKKNWENPLTGTTFPKGTSFTLKGNSVWIWVTPDASAWGETIIRGIPGL